MEIRNLIFYSCFCLAICSCSGDKTMITDSQSEFNPYKKGSVIVFTSSKRKNDTIKIVDVESSFPERLSTLHQNEMLRISATHEHFLYPREVNTFALIIAAQTKDEPAFVRFGLAVNEAKFNDKDRYFLSDLNKLPETRMNVPYGTFNDVIVIKAINDYSEYPVAINKIYWSRSAGYVRFDKYDGSYWELLDISSP